MTRRRPRPRKYVAIREKWAAALSMLLPQAQRDELRERHATAKEVIGLFDQDHVIFHVIGGPDKWWNFTPMLRAPHRQKSRRDTSTVAKVVKAPGIYYVTMGIAFLLLLAHPLNVRAAVMPLIAGAVSAQNNAANDKEMSAAQVTS